MVNCLAENKKILLVGLSFWISLIAERLTKFSFTTIDYYAWWQMTEAEKRTWIDRHDIVHYMWGHYNPYEFSYIRLVFKKAFIHYMGSDVLRAKKFGKKPRWCSFWANQTFCDSPNLKIELAQMGIKAKVLPNPVPNLVFGRPPFPRENRVLAYVNQVNEGFYHIDDVEAVATACPDWEFLIVGHDGKGRTPPGNARFFGRVEKEEVSRLIAQSKVYLRMTDHDGTGKMALEAMAMGRYVIRNMERPHTILAQGPSAVVRALSGLANETNLDLAARDYVEKEWRDDITFGRFAALYKGTYED